MCSLQERLTAAAGSQGPWGYQTLEERTGVWLVEKHLFSMCEALGFICKDLQKENSPATLPLLTLFFSRIMWGKIILIVLGP
jgi:hypothetical protein